MSTGRFQLIPALAYPALAVGLAGMVFLPLGDWLGFETAESLLYGTSNLQVLVTSSIVAALTLVAARLGGARLDQRLEIWRERVLALPGTGFVLAAAALAIIVDALLSGALFSHNPHLVDSIAQLFQARIFLAGSLSAPAPDQIEFFAASHLVEHVGRWFSQYPPGHPALLALGMAVGLPWLVNPVFAGGTVLLVFLAARRLLGEGSAKLAAVLYLLSPFALFMGASFMNHVTVGFFLGLALYAAVRATEPGALLIWPLLTGGGLGAAAAIRPLEAAAWAGVLGIWLLIRGGWRRAFAAGLACIAAALPLLGYNTVTTGHPLRFGYTLLWGPGHGLGFHTDPWGEPFTPLKSLAVTAGDFRQLDDFLFAWPYPSLIFVLAALCLAGFDREARRRGGVLAALLLVGPLAYFFYWHRDNYLGPRFLFASLIPAILLTTLGITTLDRRLARWRPALRLAVIAGPLFALAVNLPASAGVIAGWRPEMKVHPEVEAEHVGLEQGLVFVRVGWGNRLIPRLWSWGISASETERTYRAVDGCRLQQALDRADSTAAAGRDSAAARESLRQQLAEWRDMRLPVVPGHWPESSVRYDTTRALDPVCLEQVERDTEGYTLYGTLVWRNDPWLRHGIIYARDFGDERNRKLLQRYPDRPVYSYGPASNEVGELPQLRPLEYRDSTKGPDEGSLVDQ
ncbi:MAG: glycosyltransferase family 39 protein [Gemmatimonadota bacterium]|nr:MAG: glycosyltransferase family 39 protein [Gemmatimonadota bacterium]